MLPPAAKSFRCLISPSLPRPGRQCLASIRSPPQQIRKMASSTSEKSRVLEGISFSTNVNASELFLELIPLLKETDGSGRWHLTAQKNGLERRVKFKGFNKCWEFMNLVAAECKIQKHHPEWSNVYNTTFIRWTTHSPPGLSAKDVHMAKLCDEFAAKCGEVVEDIEEQPSKEAPSKDAVTGFADKEKDLLGEIDAKECCVPKKDCEYKPGKMFRGLGFS